MIEVKFREQCACGCVAEYAIRPDTRTGDTLSLQMTRTYRTCPRAYRIIQRAKRPDNKRPFRASGYANLLKLHRTRNGDTLAENTMYAERGRTRSATRTGEDVPL